MVLIVIFLFRITLCYNYSIWISFFTNKGQIGCLDNIQQQRLCLVKNDIMLQ
jgi:hypothetical protein